ncbi:hypothetical protein [Plantactinospora sp. KLBMP9567]|uniref:hypothetical protein n=1 Tax=Plantactinospora sp. KLBMP9567 TaxID=3085900 RepID=UPI002982B333|nr:hypothetical protein [Plantactinospora sp. KLBMP9567]MDW5324389.1 hypothetical protein [Plantactinospora sp. KLBMP9567]
MPSDPGREVTVSVLMDLPRGGGWAVHRSVQVWEWWDGRGGPDTAGGDPAAARPDPLGNLAVLWFSSP